MAMICEFLSKGAKDAKTGAELRAVLHIGDREFRDAVRRERLDGVPILSRTQTDESGRAGFFMPETSAEFRACIDSMKRREKEMRRVRQALEQAYNALYGA